MTISLQGVSTQDTATVNQQKIQDFKDGKIILAVYYPAK